MIDQILCIDDDEITLMLCRMTIKKAEFSKDVVTVLSGEEAIEYYENLIKNKSLAETKNYPQLIFLDLNMAGITGWDFLDDFMKLYSDIFKDTKVVILSSSVDPKDKEKAKTYSIVIDFYSKPISEEILKEIKNKLPQKR